MKRKGLLPTVIVSFLLFNQLSFAQLPIKPARTISFDTNEGSEMNVDVSPDGKTLLFDLLGDIYSVPVAGGTAHQLTSGLSINLRPSWLPSGNSFACYSDITGMFGVRICSLRGSDVNVNVGNCLPGGTIAWRTGGKFFIAQGKMYSLSGSVITTAGNGYSIFDVDENDSLYIIKMDANENIIISKRNINDSIERPVSSFRINEESVILQSCRISADKHWLSIIAITGGTYKLYVKNLPSGILKTLSVLSSDRNSLSFSPDSKYIYVSKYGKIHRISVLTGEDNIIPFTAQVKSQMGALNYNSRKLSRGIFFPKYIRSTHLSPGGKRMVFTTQNCVYTANSNGTNAAPVIGRNMNQYHPSISPDGKRIAFVTWNDSLGGALWYKDFEKENLVQVSKAEGAYAHPIWSPDSKGIAVIHAGDILKDRDDIGNARLLYFTIADGNCRVISDSVAFRNLLSFEGNQRIVYRPSVLHFNQLGNNLLVSSDLYGKHKKVIIKGGYLQEFQGVLSPCGKFIACSVNEDMYLVPIKNLDEPPCLYQEDIQHFTGIRFAMGVDPAWQNEKVLGWTFANKYYQVNPDSIMAAASLLVGHAVNIMDLQKQSLSVTVTPLIYEIEVKEDVAYGKGNIAFTHARIITMKGKMILEDGTLLIKDGRIVQAGATKDVKVPKNYKVIEIGGKTILPGLIDLHLHMRVPPDIFPGQSWMFLANLAYGVTTGRDPSLSFDSYGYKELLEAGKMIGPRLITVGRPARLNDGLIKFENLNDARALVLKRKIMGGTEIKQYGPYDFSRIQKQWLLRACSEYNMNMTNEGSGDFLGMLQMIKDGSTGVEHNLNWARVIDGEGDRTRKTAPRPRVPAYNDIIQFIAKSGSYITPTLQVCYQPPAKEYFKYTYWKFPNTKLARFTYDNGEVNVTANGAESLTTILKAEAPDTLCPLFVEAAKIDAAIYNAGGKITLGSHGNNEGIGAHNEIWALQMGGLTNHQALEIATIRGAEALGLQQDIGSIAKGKIADLVILNSNPLEDIHNTRDIKYVMKEGVLYDGDTLDTVWPYHKTCPEWRFKGTAK